MPVALRTRSWEDHVTPHSRKQYSYDDLDLVCCYAGVGESRSLTGRRRRERCASMPECCPHENCPGEERTGRKKRLSATFKGIAVSYGGDSQTVTKGQTFVTVSQTMADEESIRSKDGLSIPHHSAYISKHFLYESPEEVNKKDKEISSKSMATPSGSSSTNAVEEQNKRLNFSTTESKTNNVFKDKAKININMTMGLTEKPKTNGEPSAEGDFGDPVEEASLVHPQQELRVGVEATDRVSDKNDPEPSLAPHMHSGAITGTDLTLESRQPEEFQISKNSGVLYSSIPNSTNDQVVTRQEVLQTYDIKTSTELEFFLYDSGHTSNPETSRDKLDPIPEVSFTDSGAEAEMLGAVCTPDPHIPTTLVNLKGAGNIKNSSVPQEMQKDTPKAELLGKFQHNISRVSPDCESSAESRIETFDCTMIPQTSPGIHEEERDPRPQEVPVRLRTQKSSREDRERERCELDSMILLIMKLDQLDHEIEDALGSAPSPKDTPTAKRRFVSEVDLMSLGGDGSLSGSLHSLSTPHHQSSSSLYSVRNRTSAALSEKDRTEIEAKEACTWLRAAGFPQYAQLYEDGQFPIQISSVTRDHDFLDRDAIEALCRRLNTLNKCAMMRLEITPQRKRSEDSDEDEPCAISGRWTFQRDSKRWSRLDQLDLDVFTSPVGETISAPTFLSSKDQHFPGGHLLRERVSASAESVLTDLSEQPEVGSLHSAGSGYGGSRSITVPSSPANTNSNVATASTTRANSVASVCSSGTSGANEDSFSEGIPSPLDHETFAFDARTFSGSTGGSKSTRSRAKSFLKRMESLRLRSSSMSSKRKKKAAVSNGRLEISGPVLKEGLDEDKLRQLNCVDIATLEHSGTHNRSISYSTQTSSGSTGSSNSETSSGSAVSTPSPITRARSHSTAAGSLKRVGMYLEGFDPFSLAQDSENPEIQNCERKPEQRMTTENNLRNHKRTDERRVEHKRIEEESEVIYFYLPDGHKPGTFPKSLADGGSFHRSDGRPHRQSSTSLDSRLSFYDNVPSEMRDEDEDEPEIEGQEPKIEDVLERVTGLQRLVSAWTESGPGEEEEEEEGDSDSALDSASPCPSSPLQNRLMETENGSDQESTGNPLGEQDDSVSARERRDSGVGASLTRTNRPQKLRWPSFQNSHRPSMSSSSLQLNCQSVLQMNLLQKYSLLKLTALLEKHTPTNKHGFSWAVPKFMKRMKVRDSKERSVFGEPLQVNVQRSGQPLPQGIQQAMRYLRNHGLDQVGLFRKSGVKSRIQALRQMNESSGVEGGGVSYEGQSDYDVADMLKQYFRDLPEPLLTSKLSDTFLQIYQFIPMEQRLQAVRAAVCLLPDENRDALHTLLCFLSDVAANVSENQMTCTNLAVCLAPSLFHLNTARRDASSPRVMSRKNPLGKPDQRDLNENLAATQGLTHMIQECRKLFQIPEELWRCRNSYIEQALIPPHLEDLLDDSHSYRSLVKDSMDALLKEAKEKFKGYDTCSTPEHAELGYKKVHDGWSLRQWKVCVDVAAGAEEVLQRIVREQERWDEDLLESRVIETLDSSTDIYQYVRDNMAPDPATDYVVLRSWVMDLPKGACACVCVSVEHEATPVLGVRANVMTSRYLIEPSAPNKCRVTHISRVDRRGRCPEWYNKLYGHLCVSELVRLRDSFTCALDK